MTGKVLENNAASFLILILPLAMGIIVLYEAWPFLLLVVVLGIALKLWTDYQWRQWSAEVNPYFNQLITENQGCLTVIDLSLKANMTGGAAKRFLEKKAEEYGAFQRTYEDKGVVYYFLTASALGSIFDDSEPQPEIEEQSPVLPSASVPQVNLSLSQPETTVPPVTATNAIAKLVELKEARQKEQAENLAKQEHESVEEIPVKEETASFTPPENTPVEETPVVEKLSEILESEPPLAEVPVISEESPVEAATSSKKTLIQADLAKRLDLTSSTLARRRGDPDFPEWSQSRDPEGIAWKYDPKTKMFISVELEI